MRGCYHVEPCGHVMASLCQQGSWRDGNLNGSHCNDSTPCGANALGSVWARLLMEGQCMHACPCHRCLLLLGDNVGSLKSELFSHHNTHVHRVLRNVGTTYFWVPLLLSGSALLFHGMSWTCTSLVTTAYIARGHWLGLDVPGLAADKGVARGGGG